MGGVLRHDECWAKTTEDGSPGINVLDHCLNVGCVAEALYPFLPMLIQQLIPPGAASPRRTARRGQGLAGLSSEK